MKKTLALTAAAILATALLAGCKGRTTETTESDGSAPVEVVSPETESAEEARDSLLQKVQNTDTAQPTQESNPVNDEAK